MYKGKLGVGIVSFDRDVYIEKMLNSLSNNNYLDDTDFHLYQDGWYDKIDKNPINIHPGHTPASSLHTVKARTQHCVDLFSESTLPNKYKHVRKDNVGIAINQFEAVEELTKNYEYILLLEDDIILSPHYLRLIRVLIDQFKDVDDVFSVSLNFKKLCDPDKVNEKLNKICFARCHWWAECFSAKKWQIIRPHFMRYYDIVKNIVYSLRPRDPIVKLFSELGFNTKTTSQDAAKEACTLHCGLKRVNTVVNRGISIGERGTHFNPDVFKSLKFNMQEPYIFDSDKDLDKFEV